MPAAHAWHSAEEVTRDPGGEAGHEDHDDERETFGGEERPDMARGVVECGARDVRGDEKKRRGRRRNGADLVADDHDEAHLDRVDPVALAELDRDGREYEQDRERVDERA